MKTTDRAAFDQHLKQLGVAHGRNLVVHSRLIAFGRCDADDAVSSVRSQIGDHATLVVPTYVFGSDIVYDPAHSEPTGMGAFSRFVWQMDGAVRSNCPVHNHAGIGPIAQGLLSTNYLSSFGAGTDFEWMRDNDFDLLLLGCTFGQAATFLHHLETLAGVPYRGWVDSPKHVVLDGRDTQVPFRYFARQDPDIVECFDCIVPALKDAVSVVPAPYGQSFLVSLQALEKIGLTLLEQDAFSLVQRKK